MDKTSAELRAMTALEFAECELRREIARVEAAETAAKESLLNQERDAILREFDGETTRLRLEFETARSAERADIVSSWK